MVSVRGYVNICGEFKETGLTLDDLKNRDKIAVEVRRAFVECVGVEAEEIKCVRSVMAKD